VNDRLSTLLGACLALLLSAWLLIGAPEPEPPKVSRPSSTDEGPAGLQGLFRWLEVSSVPAQRLRERYTGLAKAAPGTGNLLIVSMPMALPVRPSEAGALRDWVRAGNHLLLLTGPAERMRWSWDTDDDSGLLGALDLERGSFALTAKDGAEDEPAPVRKRREICGPSGGGTISGPTRRLRPTVHGGHPLLDGVGEVLVKSPPPPLGEYALLSHTDYERYSFAMLCDPQLRMPVFNMLRLAEGRVWALDYGEAFANDNIDRGANAQLFAHLVAFVLARDGRVLFDDMHQGESELYDADAFFADPRLHGTFAFLFGMWLLWLLGYSSRFAPPVVQAPRQGSRAFMLSAGRFQARYLRKAEAARGLLRHFFNQIRQRHRLPTTGEPAWEALERSAAGADAELAQLRSWHAQVQGGRPVNLTRLRNLLLRLQDTSK
jgi:hypothetical protein